jgi:hypothetical protein
MNISILADAPASDHSARQFLPASATVKGPRFRRRQWETSQQVREILDGIHAEVSRASANAPAPRSVASSESIVMEGPMIRATYRSESGVVATREFTTSLGHEDDALSIAAAAALVEINRRKVAPARRTAPRPAASPWMLKAVAVALSSGALMYAAITLSKAVL